MNLNTINWFGESMLYGDKHIYQTVPRLLTLWLELTTQYLNDNTHKETNKATVFLSSHVEEIPTYKASLSAMYFLVMTLYANQSGTQLFHNWSPV